MTIYSAITIIGATHTKLTNQTTGQQYIPRRFVSVNQYYHISERLLRATKHGKLLRAAWKFGVVLNLRQKEIPNKKLPTLLQYLHNYVPSLGNLKCFNGHKNQAYFIVHWSIAALNFVKKIYHRILVNPWFVKVALEITKRSQHCVLPLFTCFCVFRNRTSLLAFSQL